MKMMMIDADLQPKLIDDVGEWWMDNDKTPFIP